MLSCFMTAHIFKDKQKGGGGHKLYEFACLLLCFGLFPLYFYMFLCLLIGTAIVWPLLYRSSSHKKIYEP